MNAGVLDQRASHRPVLFLLGLAAVALAGCAGNLPAISDQATISVWRDMPGRGLRTGAKVVVADVRADRPLFLRFYRRTRRVGLDDPIELERGRDARGLLFVQFKEPGRPTIELHVLQDRDGAPLTTGHGPVDVFARVMRSPVYRYWRSDVRALAEWLSEHTPPPPPTLPGLP